MLGISMLNVFLIHGYRSHTIFMLEFYNSWKRDEAHFKTEVHMHNWNAGEVIESTFWTGLGALFSPQSFADKSIEEWDVAMENLEESSSTLAKNINSTIKKNGDVLLVAHSTGTEVVLNAIEQIRSDINIYLFLMGGISNSCIFEEKIEHTSNIRLAYNYYSDNDVIIDKVLPEIGVYYYDPIGTYAMDGDKILSLKINEGHSGYLTSTKVLAKYTDVVKKLLNKGPNSHLKFVPS